MENFNIVMEEIGFGRVHLFATITLGLVQMLTIHETMGMAVIGPAAVCDLRMNQRQLATLFAAGFMGIICSSYFWGYITDKKGRRWTLLRTIVLSNLCSVASMFTFSFIGFFVMRFVTCIFVAGPSFVAATYLSEFCSHRILVRTITHMYMFTGFAIVSVPAWGMLFMSNLLDFEVELGDSKTLRPWRALGCVYILPGVFAFFLLLLLPESPKFLFMMGDTQKGFDTMEWISQYAYVRRRKDDHSFLRSMLDDAMPLVRKPFMGYFLCVCLVMFILGLLAHGLGIWYCAMRNRLFMRQGNTKGWTFCFKLFVPEYGPIMESEDDFVAVCNDTVERFTDSFILGSVYVVLHNICWLSLFCVHMKVVYVISLVAASTFGFLLIIVTDIWMQLFSLVFLLAIPGVLIGLLGGALLGFVPTYMRAKALCISLMWCRCGAAVGAILVGVNIRFNCELFLMAIAGLPLIAASMEGYLPL